MEKYASKEDHSLPSKFWDVNDNAWYANDVKIAYTNGIISGISPIRFDPTGKISREQFSTIIYNIIHYNSEFEALEIAIMYDLNSDDKLDNTDAYLYEDLLRTSKILDNMHFPNEIKKSKGMGGFGYSVKGENDNIEVIYSIYRTSIKSLNGLTFTNSDYDFLSELAYEITNYGTVQGWKEHLINAQGFGYDCFYGPYEYGITPYPNLNFTYLDIMNGYMLFPNR